MSSLGHLTRHIDPGERRIDRSRAYSAADLADLCVRFLQIPYNQWDKERKQALQNLKEWYSNWDQLCYENEQIVPSLEDMSKVIDYISTAFYDGLLSNVTHQWKTIANRAIYAYTDIPDEDDADWPRIFQHPGYRPGHMLQSYHHQDPIIGTLIHESIHGFLGSYACESATCGCITTSSRSLGATGHGPAFLQIATHIEAIFAAELEATWRPAPDLYVQDSMQKECAKSGLVLNDDEIEGCAQADRAWIRQYRASKRRDSKVE
ncbi:hypothetical protein Slin14017_G022000 [Septoria linicola]|nr:hypothetical protein Slin14017_G022000 [Septoria linicola]